VTDSTPPLDAHPVLHHPRRFLGWLAPVALRVSVVALATTCTVITLGREAAIDGPSTRPLYGLLTTRVIPFPPGVGPALGETPSDRHLPIYDFQIGDVIHRGAVGAVVPPLGRWVVGSGFLANPTPGSNSDIRTVTSMTGVVLIEPPGSRCQLARPKR
jgi:hypothetical protein